MTGLDLETFLSLSLTDLGVWLSAAVAAALVGILVWTSRGPRKLLRRCLAASLLVHVGLLGAGGQAALSLRVISLPPEPTPETERIQEIVVRPEAESGDFAGAGDLAETSLDGSGQLAAAPLAPWQRPGALASQPRPDEATPRPASAPSEPTPTLLAMAPIAAEAATPDVEAPPSAPPEDRSVDSPANPPEPLPALTAAPAVDAEMPNVVDAPRRDASAPRPSAAGGLLTAEANPRPRPPARPSAEPLAVAVVDGHAPDALPDLDLTGSPGIGAGEANTPAPTLAPSDLAADLPATGGLAPATAAARPRATAPTLVMPGLSDLGRPRPTTPAPRVGRTAPAEALAVAAATPLGAVGSRLHPGRDPIATRPLPEVPEVYRPRLDPNRSTRAQQAGASAASEQAVERALVWLAKHQDADGRWDAATMRNSEGVPIPGDDDYTVHCPPGDLCFGECHYWEADSALTGLSLLAYLGAGYTHRDGKAHTRTVSRGIDYLLSIQRPDGDLRGQSRAIGLYCHSMAALALCEAYALTGDPRLRDPVERAVSFLVRARSINGMSWRYAPGAPDGDTSLLGWVILVLKSAKEIGIPISSSVQQGAARWLKLVSSGASGGLAAYQPGKPATATMTAEAWVCRQFLGIGGASPASSEAATYLLERPDDRGAFNVYYLYYGTLAMYQHGGDPWERWNARVRDEILSRQKTSGHQNGSWDPDESEYGKFGGRIYATALATLSLEVYYRYLRLYDAPASPPVLAPGGDPALRRAGSPAATPPATAPRARPVPRPSPL